jgi:hypothetical protein
MIELFAEATLNSTVTSSVWGIADRFVRGAFHHGTFLLATLARRRPAAQVSKGDIHHSKMMNVPFARLFSAVWR